MAQQGSTLNFIIHDVNGQPQVIKLQTSQNKQIMTPGLRPIGNQAVRAIIKQPSNNSEGNQIVSGNTMTAFPPGTQILRTVQSGKGGRQLLTIPIQTASNINVKSPSLQEQANILPKTIHLTSQQLMVQNTNPQKNFISPILDHSGSRKRQEVEDEYIPEYKRRKTEKGGKGLRHFSMKVCEKVRKKGTTSYNEVADELVSEFTNPQMTAVTPDQIYHGIKKASFQLNWLQVPQFSKWLEKVPNDTYSARCKLCLKAFNLSNMGRRAQYDQKNIRRRVYDALNVLMAMNIISKEKKEIKWLGLPTNSIQECLDLVKEKKQTSERIRHKTQQLHELILQQISFKQLVERNFEMERIQGTPAPNSAIQLPFIVVNTGKKTVIDCSISNDKTEYLFVFDDKFEIHDDIEVLKRMGLVMGLDKGQCSEANLTKAKSMVPPSLEKYVIQLASGVKEYDQEDSGTVTECAGPSSVEAGIEVSRQTSLSDPLSPTNEFSDEESDISSDLEVN